MGPPHEPFKIHGKEVTISSDTNFHHFGHAAARTLRTDPSRMYSEHKGREPLKLVVPGELIVPGVTLQNTQLQYWAIASSRGRIIWDGRMGLHARNLMPAIRMVLRRPSAEMQAWNVCQEGDYVPSLNDEQVAFWETNRNELPDLMSLGVL